MSENRRRTPPKGSLLDCIAGISLFYDFPNISTHPPKRNALHPPLLYMRSCTWIQNTLYFIPLHSPSLGSQTGLVSSAHSFSPLHFAHISKKKRPKKNGNNHEWPIKARRFPGTSTFDTDSKNKSRLLGNWEIFGDIFCRKMAFFAFLNKNRCFIPLCFSLFSWYSGPGSVLTWCDFFTKI